jgi:tetratricopeptide (TPR) repeat protein
MTLPLLALLLFQQPDLETQGMKALEAKDYTAAVMIWEKAVAAEPSDYAAHFHLALSNSLLARFDKAVEGYRKVLELKPGLYEAQLNLGIALVELEKHKDAIPLLRAALAQQPREFQPNFFLGEALMAEGDLTGAETVLRTSVEIDPKQVMAISALGRTLLRQGKLKESEPLLRQAAAMDPVYRNNLLALADRYAAAKDTASAAAIYREFPGDKATQEQLGAMLLEAGQNEEAVAPLEAALKESPTAENFRVLAIAYRRVKNLPKAGALLDQAVKAHPADAQLRLAYARVLQDLKNGPASVAQFEQTVRLDPKLKDGWIGLSTTLLATQNYEGAVKAIGQLEALGDPHPVIYYMRGVAYDHLNRDKEAIADYQKFLSLSKDQHPDEEFKARERARILNREVKR